MTFKTPGNDGYRCRGSTQILADLSTCSTERDRLRPSTPCVTVLIIWQLFPTQAI